MDNGSELAYLYETVGRLYARLSLTEKRLVEVLKEKEEALFRLRELERQIEEQQQQQ